jgi:tetratricopeptide (TPR) repeat protein
LERYAPTWLAQMPALVSSEQRERLRHETLGATSERMLREMAETIEALTAEAPLILVLEDLHWSDYATLDLLGALARRRETARLLVIGTYRPVDVIVNTHPLKGLKQELQGHGQCEEVALELLTPPQVATYLAGRFSESALAEELASVIHRRTDGNPLFLVNFVEYLLAREVLYLHGTHWELRGGIQHLEEGMPESIRQMLERQIERLTPGEQQILEAASVVGLEFTAAAVEAALEEQEGASEEPCDRLARQQRFLYAREPKTWPDGAVTASYAFTHALYQNVLLQRVAVVRRLRFHQRIGERLERGYETRTHEIAVELAMHFEQGREYRRAIHYLRQAAEQAGQRYANREARQYLTHALGLIGKIPESEQADFRRALLEQRGMVARAMGDMTRAAEDFSALAMYAQELKLVEQEISALSQLATALSWINRDKCLEAEQRAALLSHDAKDETLRIYVRSHTAYWHLLWRGWRREDMQACTDAVAVARRVGDRAQLGVHLLRLSFFLCLHSDYRAACEVGEEGLQVTREVGDVHNHLMCRLFLTRALLLGGRWGETLRMLREGSEMAERNGHQRWALLLRLTLARVYEETGDFIRARDLCSQGLQQAQQMPLPYGQLVSTVTLGFAQLGLGQLQQAFEVFNGLAQRLEHERLLLDWIWQIPLCLGIGEYWLTQQDYERARLEAEHLCELAAQPGERTYLALGHRLLAEIAVAQRKWEEAETALTQAIAVLAGAEAPLAEWRVYVTAARVADLRRRKAQARGYWEHSQSVLLRLADSLEQDDPLRQTFLAQPLVTEILQRG